MSKNTPANGHMKIKRGMGERIFDVANCVFLGLLCFTFIYPFWYLFAVSIADAGKQAMSRIYFLPTYFSLDSYKNVLHNYFDLIPQSRIIFLKFLYASDGNMNCAK